MKEKLNYATWARAFGAVFILLCHYCEYSSNNYIKLSSNIWNIGVQLFFILSAFLFGTHAIQKPYSKWYNKRLKRIYIPLIIFSICLFIIFIIKKQTIKVSSWLLLAAGLHGCITSGSILGAGHTWFITSLILCYIFTPLISFAAEKIKSSRIWVFTVVMFVMPAVLSLAHSSQLSRLVAPLFFYAIAFIVGKYKDRIKLSFPFALLAVAVTGASFAARFVLNKLCDGTFFYDDVVAVYTHWIAAFGIFYLFAFIFKNIKPWKIVTWFSDISFEVYLYHYMFVVGPVSLFGITSNWVVDCIIVTAVTIIIAKIANFGTELIDKISVKK